MMETISREKFHELTRPLVGMPVSRTWRGYGSAIFLELGQLREKVRKRKDGSTRTILNGESSVMIEWSWRVEKARSIAFGSWSNERKITNGVARLQGLEVLDVAVEGRIPELVIQLSGGYWVHTFMTTESQPEWCLFFRSGLEQDVWVESKNGRLCLTTEE